MGRPAKGDDLKRSRNFRCEDELWEDIQVLAHAAKVSSAEWIRRACLAYAEANGRETLVEIREWRKTESYRRVTAELNEKRKST